MVTIINIFFGQKVKYRMFKTLLYRIKIKKPENPGFIKYIFKIY